MSMQRALGVARVAFAMLTFTAAGVQLDRGLQRDGFSVVNFLSFFTIESNLFAAMVLLVTGFVALRRGSIERYALWRGAATAYMVTTGITYTLLLRGLEAELQTAIPWVNTVLHYVFPVVMLLDWLLDPPRGRVETRQAVWWLVFPLAYAIYSLVRGPVVDWYPYPFIDPRQHGYPTVLVTCVLLAVAIGLIAYLLAWYTRTRRALAI